MSPGKSKSWIPFEGIPDEGNPSGLLALPKPKFGLAVVLAVVTMLFFLLLVAYTSRMQISDWRPLPEPRILWVNTGVLILSSVAFEWTKVAWARGELDRVRVALLAAGLLTFLFLAGQLLAWQQIRDSGYLLEGNPATSFFYLITLIHGLHLIGGLVAWLRTFLRFRNGSSLLRIRINLELCAAYWHFLLVVWLVFYGLMLST
ncbi:MAG: cytochrome c oxidase subunit 3 [Gammaproteobacteria bacterium]